MKDNLAANRRFLSQVEQAIQVANNEIIHKQVAPITTERMLSFAVAVAKLRANYIELAFRFADAKHASDAEEGAVINELDVHRERFEIARNSFMALQRAIELGYVTVE